MRIGKWVLLILILFCITFFIWSFREAEEIKLSEQLEYPHYDSHLIRCDLLDLFSGNQISVTYPAHIDKKSSGKIIINIQSKDNGKLKSNFQTQKCSLKVNTSLNLPSAYISPGKSAIYPYSGQETFFVKFDVFPIADVNSIEGNAYISVDVKGSETANHLLIYVAPIKIQVRALWGYPPLTVRIISLACLVILGLIYLAVLF